jgi:hypothetical protein
MEAMSRFHDRTGWRLRLQMPQPEPQKSGSKSSLLEMTIADAVHPAIQVRNIDESDLEYRPATAGKRPMKEKAAEAEIVEAFSLAPETWRPSRIKMKTDERGEYLELAFLTPELGFRQKRTMQSMADATGHRLRVRPNVNTYDLVEIARKLVPREWRLMKQPSLHRELGLVRIKVAEQPSGEQLIEICNQYEEMTGFRLDVVV